jgi:hypothetical protein
MNWQNNKGCGPRSNFTKKLTLLRMTLMFLLILNMCTLIADQKESAKRWATFPRTTFPRNYISSNLISPSHVSLNLISPIHVSSNLISPSYISPSHVSSNLISSSYASQISFPRVTFPRISISPSYVFPNLCFKKNRKYLFIIGFWDFKFESDSWPFTGISMHQRFHLPYQVFFQKSFIIYYNPCWSTRGNEPRGIEIRGNITRGNEVFYRFEET